MIHIFMGMTRKWIAQREKPSYTWYFGRMVDYLCSFVRTGDINKAVGE